MKLRHKSFLLRFPFYIGLTAAIMAVIVALWSWQQYQAQQEKIAEDLKTQTLQLERSYNVLIDHVTSLMNLIRSQVLSNPADNDSINAIMERFRSSPQFDHMYVWTTFAWVDDMDMMRITTVQGMLKQPHNMSSRDYLKLTKKNPGKLFLGVPATSPINQRWIIPGGIGVEAGGRSLGTVTLGIDTALLANHLQHAITQRGIHFILLDKNGKEVPGMMMEQFQLNNVAKIPAPALSVTPLSRRDSYKITPLEHGHYILYVSYDWHTAYREFWLGLGMHLVEIAIIGVVLLILLGVIYSHIIKPLVLLSEAADQIANGVHVKKLPRGRSYETTNLAIQLARLQRSMRRERQIGRKLAAAQDIVAQSDKLRDRFARRISYEMKKPLHTIAEMIELLMMHHLGALPTPLAHEEEQQSLKNAYQAMLQLQLFTSDTVILTDADPVALIKESVAIQAAAAMHKQLTIIQNIQASLPKLRTDETKFKQVITGLLTRILDFAPEKTVIRLNAGIVVENNRRFLSITIDDNGLGFNNEMRSRWQSRWEEDGLGLRPDGTDFSPAMITRLLEYLGGMVHYEDVPAQGSKVTVRFLYDELSPPASFIEFLSSREVDNVVLFPKRGDSAT